MNEPTAAESPCRRGAALHAEQHRPLLQTGQNRARGDPPGTPIPMHPAPSPGPMGGPSSPRSPTPAACRPPGVPVPCSWAAQPPAPLTPPLPPRRALALSGGGGAGAGPWASAGAEDGVFPALSRSCCCLSSASPARCEGERWVLRSRVGFRVVQGRGCWWGRGGRGGFRCPPLGGVTPQHGALSALEGMKRHQAGGKGALGGVLLASHGLRPPLPMSLAPQILCPSLCVLHGAVPTGWMHPSGCAPPWAELLHPNQVGTQVGALPHGCCRVTAALGGHGSAVIYSGLQGSKAGGVGSLRATGKYAQSRGWETHTRISSGCWGAPSTWVLSSASAQPNPVARLDGAALHVPRCPVSAEPCWCSTPSPPRCSPCGVGAVPATLDSPRSSPFGARIKY